MLTIPLRLRKLFNSNLLNGRNNPLERATLSLNYQLKSAKYLLSAKFIEFFL
jgi:hypothetical protein